MIIAKIAYLTSPAPNVFILNYQEEGKEGIERVEISRAHLANIICDGASYAFREASKTAFLETQTDEREHERAAGR